MSENGSKRRPYIVLEQTTLSDAFAGVLDAAEITLTSDQWAKIASASTTTTFYTTALVVEARNGSHALTIAGRTYEQGVTPPLVAVSERMFRPRRVNVEFEPKVSLA